MSPAEQCAANLAAVALAQRLVRERREPTPGERGALMAYTGFGDTQVRKHAMAADGRALPALEALGLGDAALDSLRRSVLTSFYTPPDLCAAVWAALLHLGLGELRAPRVLEPSAGTGRFLDAAPWYTPCEHDESEFEQYTHRWPEDPPASFLRCRAPSCRGTRPPRGSHSLAPGRVVAVEIDECAALVLRALHPSVDARSSALEDLDLPPVFDVVVGNVPFGSFRVSDPRFPQRLCQPIHDYFVCRSASLLRPGGVAALVTSKSTLDRLDGAARRWLAERVDLLAAYRLPQGAFDGTSACADLLFLQRLGPWSDGALADEHGWRRLWSAVEGTAADWTELDSVDFAGPGGFPARDRASRWLAERPDHVLGAWCQDRLSRDRPDASVCQRPGDPAPAEALRALAHRLPAGALLRGAEPAGAQPAGPRAAPAEPGGWSPATPQEFALARLLRAVRRVCGAGPADGPQARRALSMAYDGYRAKYGAVGEAERKGHPLNAATRERWWPLVAGVETPDGAKGAVFREDRSRGGPVGRPETAADAFYRVLDERGSVTDLQEVADLLGGDG